MPRLESERLLLRPPEPGDAVKIAKWLSDVELAKTTTDLPHPFKREHAEVLIASATEKLAKGEAYSFAVVHKATGLLIGYCSLSIAEGAYKLSYWLGRVFWNQGYGSETAKRVLSFAFHDLKAEKVLASWYDDNPGSWHVLERLGFRRLNSFRHESPARGEEALCNRAVVAREDFGRKRCPAMRAQRPVLEAVGA